MSKEREIAAALREGLDGLNDEIGKLEERLGFATLWSNAALRAELDGRLAELRTQAAQTERDLAALEPPRAAPCVASSVAGLKCPRCGWRPEAGKEGRYHD